jgi:hypothetical protein
METGNGLYPSISTTFSPNSSSKILADSSLSISLILDMISSVLSSFIKDSYELDFVSFSRKISNVYLDLKKSIKELVLKPITNRDPNIEKLIKIVIIHKKLA